LKLKKLFYCAILIFLAAPALLTAQDKPLLSQAIREVIDTQGNEAAKKHFAEQHELQKDAYEIDMKGITELSNSYVKAGNYEAAGVVMEITSPFMQDMYKSQMSGVSNEMAQQLAEMEAAEKEKQKKISEEEQLSEDNYKAFDQGEARNDLERFTGLYGEPAEKNEHRRLWVMVSCDGHLVSGALWGDVAPWWMKTEGDKAFSYADSFVKLNMEFETDANGKAVRMGHDLSYMKTPLERLGPVPDDWEPCLEPPERVQHR
jgi:hypothetical protein